jgi:hypothetical protein
MNKITWRIVIQHSAAVLVTAIPLLFTGSHIADDIFTALLFLNFIVYLIRLYRAGAFDFPDRF